MRLASLLGPDLRLFLESSPNALREALAAFHPEDVAEILEDLPLTDAVELTRTMPPELAADVLERLSQDRQVAILRALDDDRAMVLSEMDPDDRVDVLQEFPASERQTFVDELAVVDEEAAEEVRELVVFEPETAGGLMTTDVISVGPETKVWEAIETLRSLASRDDVETVYYIYVCGYGGKLLGVVSLRDLILSGPGQEIQHLMRTKVVHVGPFDDQEEVASVIARYDLSAVPVVDESFTLLGLVTVDDVVDVVIDEATEDVQMMGGMVPLEDSYFDTGLREFVWKRGIWLVVLFMGQLLTATVMEMNEAVLRQTLALAIFIPLIISSGGNAGSQSSTLIIRGMSVGEMNPGDWMRVLSREVVIGLALGLILGGMGFARAFFTGEGVAPGELAVTVSVSILAVVVLSSVVGSLLPMLIQRVGLDPAVSSTPFIASVVDVLGLVVYFSVAQAILTGLS